MTQWSSSSADRWISLRLVGYWTTTCDVIKLVRVWTHEDFLVIENVVLCFCELVYFLLDLRFQEQ